MKERLALISVVIPSFNAAGTVGQAIQSALAQEGVAFEVLIVDDGSTDDSLAVVRSFEPAVRVVTGPNCGVSAARNGGIMETTGQWIVFLDSDDLLVPGTLRMRLATAELTEADVVVCDWQEFIDHDGSMEDGPVKSVDMAALAADAEIACATHVWVTTAALMYRRTLVERIGGFREDLPVIEDARFLFDAAYHGACFAHSPHIGARYRVMPQSLSRSDPQRFWRCLLLNGKQIEALWRSRSPLSTEQREALAGIFNHAARGLFAASHPEYFEAVECQRRVADQVPLHPRIAEPLARAVSLNSVRRLLGLLGR